MILSIQATLISKVIIEIISELVVHCVAYSIFDDSTINIRDMIRFFDFYQYNKEKIKEYRR